MDAVRRFLDGLASGGYRLTLRRSEGHFVLACTLGDRPAEFSHFLKLCTAGQELKPLLDLEGTCVVVPLGRMSALREALTRLASAGVAVSVAPEAERFREVPPPPGFSVSYDWDVDAGCIVRHTTDGATYYGYGWFMQGDTGWPLPGTTVADHDWLARASIAGADIPRFLGEAAADWDQRPIACQCTVRHDPEPALTLHVRAVADDSAEIAVTWHVPPDAVTAIPDLPGYVLVGATVRPGVSPVLLAEYLPSGNGAGRLVGQDVPRFLRDIWPHTRQWAVGRVEELERRHATIAAPGVLSLVVRHERRNGVGGAIGVPVVTWGDIVVDAESLSRALRVGTEFVRLPGGWLPAEAIRRAGVGPMGRMVGGERLAPVPIGSVELLHRGSPWLAQRWPRVDFSAFKLPKGGSDAETAVAHLRWLVEWGISGGLVGGGDVSVRALASVLADLMLENPQLRVLVVGTRRALGGRQGILAQVAAHWWDSAGAEPQRSEVAGVVLATATGLRAHVGELGRHWDVLCLLEADSLVRSQQSRLYRLLAMPRAALTLGLFDGLYFAENAHAQAALARLFRVPDNYGGRRYWRYVLRHPAGKSPGLPPPFVAPRSANRALTDTAAELTLGDGGAASTSMPVPPPGWIGGRDSQSPLLASERLRPVDLQTQEFLVAARAYANRTETAAHPVPFRGYMPTYDALSPAQQRWYFYWRARARAGECLDTDPAYVLLHIYELINGIGIADADDGYEQLHRLWLHKHWRGQALGDQLTGWLSDYAAVYGCSAGPLAIYLEAFASGTYAVSASVLLTEYAKRPLSQWPLALVEVLSDHSVREGRLYAGPHQHEVTESIAKALEAVDRAVRASGGCSVLELFRPPRMVPIIREPFRGARYGGDRGRVVIANIWPYHEHAPLREFMTGVLKHCENCLRKRHDVRGRLHGYTLDAEVVAAVEEVLLGRKPPVPPAPAVVRIDLARAEAIARESDEVRDMLLASAADSDGDDKGLAEARLADQPLGQRGGLAPEAASSEPRLVNRGDGQTDAGLPPEWLDLAGLLSADQLAALAAIVGQGDVVAVLHGIAMASATMPAVLVDSINELAVATVGDIIIDPAAEPPAILEESAEAVRALVAHVS